MTDNPLLQTSSCPNAAPDFEKIQTEHYLPAVETAIEEARANIETIKGHKDTADFDNVFLALETGSETLGTVTSVFYNQLSAAGSDDLHELAEKIGPINAAFGSDVMLDEELFARVKEAYDRKDTYKLTTEQETLIDDTYKSFVRGGALLNEEDKETLRGIDQQLSTLGPVFMNNVSKSSEKFELIIDNKDDLAGLPNTAIDGAAHAATEKGHEGKWLFNLDYPSFGPFMQFADNSALREKIWRAFNNRAFGDEYDNCETVLDIVKLRYKRARLLGYETHAHYVLERRMAEAPEEVLGFLEKLKSAYKPAALKDLDKLQEFAKSQGLSEELMPWDVGYYAEKLKQSMFEFSSEDLRPYFPLETVLEGCFAHFTKLFNLRFKENKDYAVWHEDVQSFDVFEADSDKFIGTFYADFFPRIGKKPGAWKTGYRSQGLFNGKIERPVIAIVCNFTKPTADKPSLLTHGEVTTLFHEMGHAVHALASDVTYSSLAGTNVKWDFVELPSQLQENWCYQKETLDMISGHYETGDKIPEELIKKLNEAKNFMVAWGGLRQVALGSLDMSWHMTDPKNITDLPDFEDKATADTTLFPRYAGPSSTSFGHLFAGGYSAGYYSYKWAEVLDADAFEAFLEKGLYDQSTATSYKDNVLAKGGSQHPRILYKSFRGRDADPDSLLRREGLLDNKNQAA